MGLFEFIQKLHPDSFQTFWESYPLRHAKKDARKAWMQLNPSDELVAQIVEHVTLRMKTRQWREGYIPLPATFIRGERWEDELTREDFYQAKL
jgi:hypothetical protein